MSDGTPVDDPGSPVPGEPARAGFLLLPISESALRVAREVGRKRVVDAGEVLQIGGGSPWLGVVGTGVLRALVASSSGRHATLAYAPPGAVIGVPGVFSGTAVVTIEAMVRSEVFDLPLATLRARTKVDPQLALAVAEDLAQLVEGMVGEASALAFGDLKTRASRHLLVLAGLNRKSHRYEARLTHADVANAIASTPDAVGRVLRQMAREGLVALFPGRIQLLDIERLLSVSTDL